MCKDPEFLFFFKKGGGGWKQGGEFLVPNFGDIKKQQKINR